MKRISALFIFLFLGHLAISQVSVAGKIADQADDGPLANASIVLLDQDSIMKYFVRADENGKFQLKNVITGSYLLLVSYPKFEVYSQPIVVENEDLNLESIKISSQANLIEEVIVKQKLPITLKGDTIEYDAGSFETEKNAKLEDLLRRLPGLTVSADGAITAQGKSVSKVLIDGEEFFGYDPKIAIRNVRADAVDKVQVYERRSEQSELTGIDDGVRLQTVNVVLKEEAREGVFGNLEALYGTDNLYAGNLFAAKFNRTERMGVTANTNNMGASGREGNLRMNNQIQGEPVFTSIGANYENQFFDRKLNVNANYNLNDNSNRNERDSFNKQIQSNGEVRETTRTSRSMSNNQSHGVRSQFRIRIDSTQNMDVRINAGLSQQESGNSSNSKTRGEGGNDINEFESDQNTKTDSRSNDIRLNYRKRLNKKGASLNVHVSNDYSKSDSENRTDETTTQFIENTETNIDQRRLGDNFSNNFSAEANFGNRLSQQINYSLGYSFSNSNRKNFLDAFDLDANGTPSELDLNYSQRQHDFSTNQGINATMNFNHELLNINVSNKTLYKNQNLEDSYRDVDLSRSFWDNSFNMDINYRLSSRKNLRVSYQNSNTIPSFEQLQPTQPRRNELFIPIGNPDLERATNNNFRLNYNTISLLKGTNLNLNGDIGFVVNPIINQLQIDRETNVTRSSYVNISDKSTWRASMNGNFNKPMFNKQVQFNIFSSLNYQNSFSFIENSESMSFELNNLQNTNGNIGIGVNEQNAKGFDFEVNARIGANNQLNSLRSDLNYTNMTGSSAGYIKYFFPWKFQATTNVNYSYEGPTKLYPQSIHQFYANVELSKKLLKNESLIASVKAFDIFNTFNNVNRSISDTDFTESRQLILTQYVLVGLKWDFNKNLGKKND
ncbi:hypothetical protein FAZ19_02210 [Sphingobacterium alkalisoli]|uniref:Outer membrane protein beta-barrel domain-containing protein n=1 Tax=Sphingobacterium alkalisoli TaxID=1874115 RepID=A0A4U0H8L9_9SPHI|nr:TonB-dependent receptor [Sphingobacterium alkalisoli]TJY68096.1 hypothetical protein FAZ19_02210 [Sphingobacterium alkalisoli]GGH09088.1 collagen-binding protein [Sphingobacterium alkalisoli]